MSSSNRLGSAGPASSGSAASLDPAVERILDDARWAPSGDNAQPWRFEVLGPDGIIVHLNDRDLSVYEYRDAEPVRLSGGMLIESLRIAASAQGRAMTWQSEGGPRPARIEVRFTQAAAPSGDPLFPCLRTRSVNRWPYKTRPLRPDERAALTAAMGDAVDLTWYETADERRSFAQLAAQATAIRLTTPEAFPTHQSIIDWDVKLSPSKIPAGALGLDRPTLLGMRWGMQSWRRTSLMNLLGAVRMAAGQMDHKPINGSAAVFAVRLRERAASPEQRAHAVIDAGRHIQRFWLTATSLGLAMQPALAPLIFADYGQKQLPFTKSERPFEAAKRLAAAFRQFFGDATDDFLFMGRIGEPGGSPPDCRSVRRPVSQLLVTGSANSTR